MNFQQKNVIQALWLSIVYLALLLPVAGNMPVPIVVVTIALAGVLIWLSIVDFQTFRIPNLASLIVLFLGVAVIWSADAALLWAHSLTAALGYVVMVGFGWAFTLWLNREALGLGDAKLFGAGLLWVGPLGSANVLLIAAFGGLLFALFGCWGAKGQITRKIPFGPFLSFGIYAVWLYGPTI